jgi:hypothetical protein
MLELLARAKSGEGVKSGPIGLAVILLLCVAVYFLFKSMSRHLKKVREEFPSDDAARTSTDRPQPADTPPPPPSTTPTTPSAPAPPDGSPPPG